MSEVGKRGEIDLIWYHGPQGMKTMAERLQPKLGKDTNISKWHIGVAFVGDEGIVCFRLWENCA